MLFCEPFFLFLFLPCVVACYHLLPAHWRNAFLSSASVLFYAFGEARFLAWLGASILLNYVLARAIQSYGQTSAGRMMLAVGIFSDLGLLVVFKYGTFVLGNVNHMVTWLGFHRQLPVPHWILPIGISFFTFHKISYKIDVYRGTAAARRGLSELLLYILLFPQLIAGPIIRYHDIADELRHRNVYWQDVYEGLERFAIGLAKKLILADSFAMVADRIFGTDAGIQGVSAAELTILVAWTAAAAYTLQIYFDFSGYSDMAIGLGRMFGFHFLENFNYPYISRTITEFWRRWHMSLSRWFRDYLYIPLGGSQCGSIRNYCNLVIVFVLCGLWHGANWTFLVWGLWHGAFLVIERVGVSAWLARRGRIFQHAYTLAVVMVGWVVFRADSLQQARVFLRAMAGFPTPGAHLPISWFWQPAVLISAVVAIVASTPLPKRAACWLAREAMSQKASSWLDFARCAGFASLLVYSIVVLAGQIYSPFIYYRF